MQGRTVRGWLAGSALPSRAEAPSAAPPALDSGPWTLDFLPVTRAPRFRARRAPACCARLPGPGGQLHRAVRHPAHQRHTAEALACLQANKRPPFLVYLAWNTPHLALNPNGAFAGQPPCGRRGDVIEGLVNSLGRSRATLEREGVATNTSVIFASDNGPWVRFNTKPTAPSLATRGSMWFTPVLSATVRAQTRKAASERWACGGGRG